jgi:hypothetical protein
MKTTFLALLLGAFGLGACGSSLSCPSTQPTDGSNCSNLNLACEYSTNTQNLCTTLATCQDALDFNDPGKNVWSVAAPAASCMTSNPAACPATVDDVPIGQTCTPTGQSCVYPEGKCTCVPCDPTGVAWECRKFGDGLETGCPTMRPLIGSKCTTPNLSCSYDSSCNVSFGPNIVCTNSTWQPTNAAPAPCAAPICGQT